MKLHSQSKVFEGFPLSVAAQPAQRLTARGFWADSCMRSISNTDKDCHQKFSNSWTLSSCQMKVPMIALSSHMPEEAIRTFPLQGMSTMRSSQPRGSKTCVPMLSWSPMQILLIVWAWSAAAQHAQESCKSPSWRQSRKVFQKPTQPSQQRPEDARGQQPSRRSCTIQMLS